MPHLVRFESGLVQVPERLHIAARLEAQLVHGNVGRHAATARAAAAGANWRLPIFARVEHGMDAGDCLARAGGGSCGS